jgi:hypothetical protein
MVYIYILHDERSNFYKIGSSKYPDLRLKDQQKRSPEIKLYWTSDILVERIKEQQLHEMFESKRVKHDWFTLTDDELNILKREARTEDENVNEDVIKNNKTTEEKKSFSEFVVMTQGQHDQLAKKLGITVLNQYVERLNNYIGSKGKKYKSHYHTILSWTSKDGASAPVKTGTPRKEEPTVFVKPDPAQQAEISRLAKETLKNMSEGKF